MEHSANFYKSAIRVIDYVNDGHEIVPAEKGRELCGGYWASVGMLFFDWDAVRLYSDKSMRVTKPFILDAIREDCLYTVEVMEKGVKDRELDNRSKKVAISCSWASLVLSLASLFIAIFVK